MCSPAMSQALPPRVSDLSSPPSAQRFHLPALSQLHSSWDYLLFYCAELNWHRNKAHECTVNLRDRRYEQDLTLSNLRKSSNSTFRFTRDPGSSFLDFIPYYYTSGSDPNPGVHRFPALAQKLLTWHVFLI